jgi:NAD(P)H-quinone oxidoreductase subunit 5
LARSPRQGCARALLVSAKLLSVTAFALAATVALIVVFAGPATSPLIGASGLGLQIRIDALSAVMILLVSFIGAIVIRFGATYLDGDARQGVFMGRMAMTLGFVMMLVLSGNVVQLAISWIGTSLSLHSLIVFYSDRPKARFAAHKKLSIARVGDLCLISAAALLVSAFGTGEIAAIAEAARTTDALSEGMPFAAGLLAIAALLKSAQFPTHGWLTEVMETPTPVSALLHAGIINAGGGFLTVRFGDVMLTSAASMHLLILVGGLTAVIGSVVMLTQSSVKVGLAWSTIAQMGFMLMQCSFGAFSAAVLHIVAHSLYKAHAFLSSGSVVDLARAKMGITPVTAPTLRQAVAMLATVIATVVLIGAIFDVTLATKPALVVLGAILVMGLTHFLLASGTGVTLIRSTFAASGVALLYFILQLGTEALMASTLPAMPMPGVVTGLLMAAFTLIFALVALAQILAPSRASNPRVKAARVWIANGFYINTLFTKLIAGKPAPAKS